MMKTDQTKTVDLDGWGNCVTACVATILNIHLHDIPEEVQKDRFRHADYSFVEGLGYSVGFVEDIKDVPESVELFIAIGNGGRFYDNGKPIKHAVVWSRDGMYHDPHISKSGIESAERFEYFERTGQ